MKEYKKYTLQEYFDLKEKYFSSHNTSDKVMVFFGPMHALRIWTKHDLDQARAFHYYWEHEPIIRNRFASEEEMMRAATKYDKFYGVCFRWLPGNQHKNLIQPYCVATTENETLQDHLAKYKNIFLNDYFFGMLMDPMWFLGEYNDTPESRAARVDPNNYVTYGVEISVPEFKKLEELYLAYHGMFNSYPDKVVELIKTCDGDLAEKFKAGEADSDNWEQYYEIDT